MKIKEIFLTNSEYNCPVCDLVLAKEQGKNKSWIRN